MKLSKQIEIMRLERKWSQRELARRAGVGPKQINRYERGETQPSIEALKKIAEVFGVTSDFLLGGIAVKEKEEESDEELAAYCKAIVKMPEEYKTAAKIVLKSMIETSVKKKKT